MGVRNSGPFSTATLAPSSTFFTGSCCGASSAVGDASNFDGSKPWLLSFWSMLLNKPALTTSCGGSEFLCCVLAATASTTAGSLKAAWASGGGGTSSTFLPLFFRVASMSPKSLPVSIVWGGGLVSWTFATASGGGCKVAVWVVEAIPFSLSESSI